MSLKYLLPGPLRTSVLSPGLRKIDGRGKLEVSRKDIEEKKKIIAEIEATFAMKLKGNVTKNNQVNNRRKSHKTIWKGANIKLIR